MCIDIDIDIDLYGYCSVKFQFSSTYVWPNSRMHESRIVVNMLSLSRFCILFVDLPKYLSSSRPLKLEQSPAVFEIRLSM